MKINYIILIFSLPLILSCSNKQQDNKYLEDLIFIHNTIIENHPGIYNEQDPEFNANLKTAYFNAKSKLLKTKKNSTRKQIINDFAKSFNDTHLWIKWHDYTKTPPQNTPKEFKIIELDHSAAWIKLPSFDLEKPQKENFWHLVSLISNLQPKKYIVFDLQKNQGGNSDYGSAIIDALFGKEYADQKRCLYNKNVYVDWRASIGNLNHISNLLKNHPQNWLRVVQNGIQNSINQNEHYYREHSSEFCKTNNSSSKISNTKIVVLIDSYNVSAALDFIDELKTMTKNVVLIGKKTKADRLYMEVRSIPLPSNLGIFYFPIKVYRNRTRLDNQSYIPDIDYLETNDIKTIQDLILNDYI